MGSKTTSQQSQAQTTSPNPTALAAYNNVVSQAQNVAATPYQAYTGELTAGVNNQENTATNALNGLGAASTGYFNTASNLGNASTASVNPTAITGSTIAQYESPYQQQVINATEAQIANTDAQQAQQQTSNAIAAGAFGGDRAGVAQAALAGQQALANNSTLANLNNQNYTQALNEANTQQATNLSAAQANRSALLSGASLQAGLGSAAGSTGTTIANSQLAAGALQQQTQQAADTANYGQFENQQAYPFQTTQWLSNIIEGIEPNTGSTTTGTSTTQSNSANSILGGALGLAGLFSDKRMKEAIEPVGKTFDGQTIYKFRYKGSPTTHIGLMAQEVEKKHPHSVAKTLGGMRKVDYDEATRHAAHKGHFASGGSVPNSMPSTPYADAMGYVPAVQGLGAAHMQSPSLNFNQGGQNQQGSGLGTPMGNLMAGGKLLANSSLGDSIQDSIQDFGDNFARGGNVVDLGSARRHYDGGGVVPDADSLIYDPSLLGTGTDGGGSFVAPSLSSQSASSAASLGAVSPSVANDNTGLGAVAPVANDNQPASGLAAATSPAPAQSPASGLGAIKQAAAPAGQAGGFNGAVSRTMGFEGGYNPADTNGTPSNYGINQSANPDVDVSKLTPDQAKSIYKTRYWDTIGADNLPPALAHVAFDTAVIAGPGKAQELIQKSGGDPSKFMDLRDEFLNGLVASNPDKYGSYAKAWAARDAALRSDIGAGGASGTLGGALAYSNDPTAAPGQGIGAADTSAPSSSGSWTDNFGQLIGGTGKPTAGHSGGILGLFPGMSDDARMGLMSMGLGMMASPSKSLGMAIGQGGLQGIQAYQTSQKLAAQRAVQQAQIANTQSEIENRKGTLALGQRKEDLAEKQAQRLIDAATNINKELTRSSAPGATVSQPGTVAPPSGANGTSAPQAAVPAIQQAAGETPTGQPATSSNFDWSKVDPNSNPAWLDQQAAKYERAAIAGSMDPTQAARLSQQAMQFRRTAQQVRQNGRVTMLDGSVATIPGALEADTAKEAATARAKGTVENELKPAMSPSGVSYIGGTPQQTAAPAPGATIGGTPPAMQIDPKTAKISTSIPAAPAGGGYPVPDVPPGAKVTGIGEGAKELAKADTQFSDMVGKAPVLDQSINRFQSLAQAFKLFESGSTTERLQAGAAIAQSYGYPDIAKRILGGDPAAVQWVGKEGVQLTLDTLKAANPRFAQSEFNQLATKGTPSAEMLPQANHELVSEGLGLMERNKAFIADWQQAQQNGWQSPSAFYTQWSAANPLSGFVRAAQKQIGNFKGMDLPPSNEWVEGATYVAPKSMSGPQAQAFAKRGIQPGQLFKFNGRDSATPMQPISPANNFSSQLAGG